MYVTVRLLWGTACRLNEIASLKLRDIDDRQDHIRISINGAKTEAGNRTVVLVEESDCELLRGAVGLARSAHPTCPQNKGILFPRLPQGRV